MPPGLSSQQDVDVGDMAVDDTAEASTSSVDTKEKNKKSDIPSIRELEREIEDMTRRWIQEGGRELGSSRGIYAKPEHDSEEDYSKRRRENSDSYRPDRYRPDSYRPAPRNDREPRSDRISGRGRQSRRSGGVERGVVSDSSATRDSGTTSGANISRVKEEPLDDIAMELDAE